MITKVLFARRQPMTLTAHFVLAVLFALAVVLLYVGSAYLNGGPVSYAP